MPIISNPTIDLKTPPTVTILYVSEGVAIFGCIGNPEGIIAANTRSLALSDDGNIYLKISDTVATGWTAIGSGGGSGTVSPGLAKRIAYYPADGNTVDDTADFEYQAASPIVLIRSQAIGLSVLQLLANAATSVPTFVGSPVLEHFIVDDETLFFLQAYTNESSSRAFGTYLQDDGQFILEVVDLITQDGLGKFLFTSNETTISLLTSANNLFQLGAINDISIAIVQNNIERLRVTSTVNLVFNQPTNIPAITNHDIEVYAYKDSNRPTFVIAGYNATSNLSPYLILAKGRGSNALPTAVLSGDEIGKIGFFGYFGSNINSLREGAAVQCNADENWGASNSGSEIYFLTTKNGEGSAQIRGKWSDKGALCVANNTSGDSDSNKLLVGFSTAHNTDVVASVIAAANTESGLDVYGNSSMNAGVYIQRWWRQGDGQPRIRVQQDGIVEQQIGISTNYMRHKGTAEVNITTVGNVGTDEDDLHTYSLLANSLNENGDYLTAEYYGILSDSVNTKRIRAYLDTFDYFDSGTMTNTGSTAVWFLKISLLRLTATSQLFNIHFRVISLLTGVTEQVNIVTGSVALNSGTKILKVTGTATADNDIQLTSSFIEKGHNV